MEIHAPDKPLTSVREIALHLAIVTVGVLIALSFEQAVEWFHHHQLVAEAREKILTEIRENRQELQEETTKQRRNRDGALGVLDYINGLIEKQKTPVSADLNFASTQIRNTSWMTAQSSGALAHMSYEETQSYAAVYRQQETYMDAQHRTEEAVSSAATVFVASYEAASKSQDLVTRLSTSELEAERGRLLYAIVAFRVQLQVGDVLRDIYSKTLQAHGQAASAVPAAQSK